MKKLLKLSATALIIAGVNLLFSQSALAHTTVGDLHNQQSLCSYGYNPNCGNNGGSYGGGGVIDDYLGLAWTKDGKPFFYSAQYRTNYGFMKYHFEQSDAKTLYECNKSSRRSPCKNAHSTVNGCIAIAQVGELMYADSGATCNEAKQKAMQACQAYEGNPNTCKIYKTRKT